MEWFERCQITEQALADNQLPIELVEIDVNRIDVKRSLTNKARPKNLMAKVVERYSIAMDYGNAFPPIVVREFTKRNGEIWYEIAGGNHRFHAALENGAVSLPAYIIRCKDYDFGELAKRLNIDTGMGSEIETALDQAAQAVLSGAKTKEEAAEYYRLTKPTLDAKVRENKVIHWAREAGVSLVGATQALTNSLHQHHSDRPVFNALARVVSNYKKTLTAGKVGEVTKELREIDDQGDKLEHIKLWADSLKGDKGKKRTRRPRTKFNNRDKLLRALGTAENIFDAAPGLDGLVDLQLDADEADKVLARWRKVTQKITNSIQHQKQSRQSASLLELQGS